MTSIQPFINALGVSLATLIIISLFVAWALPSEDEINNEVDSLYANQAERAIEEYHLAARHGSPVEQCVAAQQVATAYRMAHDEKNYQDWREIQRLDCEAADVPF